MTFVANLPLVSTIKERCRVCYTCVRECPAKAIRIVGGQAEVLNDRCIGCGNCVRVCSQRAKKVYSSIEQVQALLAGRKHVAAMLAPSFPAEFEGVEYRRLVGAIRMLGFAGVHEVAFGADLAARAYRRLLDETSRGNFVAANCPAVVGYVERYHPRLTHRLAPIASPMTATARVLHEIYGPDFGPELGIVFIGPCIAKKSEATQKGVRNSMDAVLTFTELRKMFDDAGIEIERADPVEFDPPEGGAGALFPITRGLFQAAGVKEDLVKCEIVAAEGRTGFVEALREFESGDMRARLLEVLCCEGCIMGPGIENAGPLFRRRARVGRYVREKMVSFDEKKWSAWMERFSDIDLGITFRSEDRRIPHPRESEIRRILLRMGKARPEDELNCGACGYDNCRQHAVAIHQGLAECEMCLPYTIERLRSTVKELAVSNEELARVQEALVQSEKLASMGQLAAGIAHEVNNPLGVVLMYAHLLMDKCESGSPVRDDLEMIAEHTDRCKKIVAGLLNFARQNRLVCRSTNLEDLIWRGLRSMQIPDNVKVELENNMGNPVIDVDGDQINQVLVNLLKNAIDAMPNGGRLTIGLSRADGEVQMKIEDSGVGIVPENLRKVFEPFFTTKYMGKGTGLGLAVTYGIVKMHRGDIRVESNADPAAGPTGTRFLITLPVAGQVE